MKCLRQGLANKKARSKGSVIYVVVLYLQYSENTDFFQLFPWRNSCLRHLLVISLELQGKKRQSFSMVQP